MFQHSGPRLFIAVAFAFAFAATLFVGQVGLAVDFDDNGGNQTFDSGAAFSPAGTPGSGDSVTFNSGSNMTVTTNESFGNGGTPSLWSNRQFQLNGGTLTHVAGSTLNRTGGDLRIRSQGAGAGTFVNNGTFLLNGTRQRLNEDTSFVNGGTFRTDDGGVSRFLIETNSAGTSFTSTGAIEIANGSTQIWELRPNFLNNTWSHSGTFDIQDGTLLFTPAARGNATSLGGALFDGSSAPNTTLNVAKFNQAIGAGGADLPAGSVAALSGSFDEIDFTSTGHAGAGRIALGDETIDGNRARTMPTTNGGVLNITGGTNADWVSGGFETRGGTINNNGTLTAPSGGVLGVLKVVSQEAGAGTFNNNGTIRLEAGTLDVRDTTTFVQNGTFELAGNGARLLLREANGEFQVTTGNSIDVAAGAGNQAVIEGDASFKPLNFQGTASLNVSSGRLAFAHSNPQVDGVTLGTSFNDALVSSLPMNVSGSGEFAVGGGYWDEIDVNAGSHAFPVTGRIVSETGPRTASGNLVINPTSTLDFDWQQGNFNTRGGTITNNATISTVATSSGDISGGGTFINNGAIIYGVSSSESDIVSNNTVFQNNGLVELGSNGRRLDLQGTNVEFQNMPDGILRATNPTGNTTIRRAGGNATTFRNQGTIEVTGNNLTVQNNSQLEFPSITSTELAEGTYRILSSSGMARFDMRESGTGIGDGNLTNFDGTITSIASAANLVLSGTGATAGPGAGAQFPQLGEINNLEGGLFVHNSVDLPVDPALTVESTATLGGDGTIDLQGGTLTNQGTITPSGLTPGTNVETDTGTLTIDGSLVQEALGRIVLDINDAGDFDQVVVTGTADLSEGEFEINVGSGYDGSPLDVILANNGFTVGGEPSAGQFTFNGDIFGNGPGFFQGLDIDILDLGAGLFAVQLSGMPNAPEPSSIALFSVCAGAGLFYRWRRRRSAD